MGVAPRARRQIAIAMVQMHTQAALAEALRYRIFLILNPLYSVRSWGPLDSMSSLMLVETPPCLVQLDYNHINFLRQLFVPIWMVAARFCERNKFFDAVTANSLQYFTSFAGHIIRSPEMTCPNGEGYRFRKVPFFPERVCF